jgi:hypothetical protein
LNVFIVPLGAAARENDLGGLGANQRSHLASRVVHGSLRLLPVVMNTRRIAEKILEGAHHRLRRRRAHWRGGVVIQIDAHVAES